MKTLSLVNLYKSEIKKNMLAGVKGGDDVKCYCGNNNPMVSTRKSAPTGSMCICENTTTSATTQANALDR
jgi:hypothetical protein